LISASAVIVRPRERADEVSEWQQLKKPAFSLIRLRRDEQLNRLTEETDHRTLACWARDCAERVLPYFEEQYPDDRRPRNALKTLQQWIDTGDFSMKVIRGASLAAHAAARDVGEDSPARSVAHAAGQAVATAHVKTHAPGAAIYAQQAVYRAADAAGGEKAVAAEREWQLERLGELRQVAEGVEQ
jgi:hypothetical protein